MVIDLTGLHALDPSKHGRTAISITEGKLLCMHRSAVKLLQSKGGPVRHAGNLPCMLIEQAKTQRLEGCLANWPHCKQQECTSGS